tara:strand:- start:36 stop:410 length:375 start_codon:yes stop_codon:yes gene_type:complete
MKIIIGITFILLFNGCVQGTALLGPIFTGASTGSVSQAGLSYGSNYLVKNMTGKTTAENIQKLLVPKNSDNKTTRLIKKKSQILIDKKKNDNKIVKSAKEDLKKNSLDFYASVKNLYLQDEANQ